MLLHFYLISNKIDTIKIYITKYKSYNGIVIVSSTTILCRISDF